MKWSSLAPLLLSMGMLASGGCGDDDVDDGAATPPGGDGTPGGETAAHDQQIARGTVLFGNNCSSCHGASGQGSDLAPPLVGPDALPLEPRPGQKREELFVTAHDVYEFAREYMPLTAPGSLEDHEYLDIVAFDLDANGILWTGPLDEDDLEEIVLNEVPPGVP